MTDPVYDWLRLSDGTRLRTARWPSLGDARGTVFLLTGRAEFIEKYRETAEALVARGFQVATFDWRNQGLSDRPLANRQIHHLSDFTTLVDDLDAVHDALVAPLATGGPVVLMAHSMGGLVATLALARHAGDEPPRYAAAVLLAPMFAINTAPLPPALLAGLAWLGCALGGAERYALGQHDYRLAAGRFQPDNVITSDPVRHAAFHQLCAERPELRLGGVSFGWLAAALRATERLRTAVALERVRTPVLLLSAPEDRVVRADVQRWVAGRLGNATLAEHPGAKHELLMERDAIRDRVWADIDAFLDKTLARTVVPVVG